MQFERQVGGSFAPKLTMRKLTKYREKVEAWQGKESVKAAIVELIEMAELFLQTPESKQPKRMHPSGVGYVQQLDEDEIKRIWDAVPWDYEIEAIQTLFSRIDPGEDADIRNIGYHLIWYAKELTADRQPVTADKLEPVAEPVVEPVAEPVVEPVAEPAAGTTAPPAAGTTAPPAPPA